MPRRAPTHAAWREFSCGADIRAISRRRSSSKAKLCILDTLGCCIFGASLPAVAKADRRWPQRKACAGSATVFGTPLRTSAALGGAWSTAPARMPSSLTKSISNRLCIPARWRCRRPWRSPKRYATVGGRDLHRRHCCRLRSRHPDRPGGQGRHVQERLSQSGHDGSLCRRGRGRAHAALNAGQTQHAFGIAGSQAAGLMAVQDGAMTKSFHSGRAAQSGVYAAAACATRLYRHPERARWRLMARFSAPLLTIGRPRVDRRPRHAVDISCASALSRRRPRTAASPR